MTWYLVLSVWRAGSVLVPGHFDSLEACMGAAHTAVRWDTYQGDAKPYANGSRANDSAVFICIPGGQQ